MSDKLQLRVIPDQPDWLDNRFKIQWRFKKKTWIANLFNQWRTLYVIQDGTERSIFNDKQVAIQSAKNIRENPDLLHDILRERKEFSERQLAERIEKIRKVYV